MKIPENTSEEVKRFFTHISYEVENITRHLNNTKEASKLWADVPPEEVIFSSWRCGTQACFGGHLTTWPYFQALGIIQGESGQPVLTLSYRRGMKLYQTATISAFLFGTLMFNSIFSEREGLEKKLKNVSDHAIVARRLEQLLQLHVLEINQRETAIAQITADDFQSLDCVTDFKFKDMISHDLLGYAGLTGLYPRPVRQQPAFL